MPSSSLTSKGQTTIPKPIRDHLRLQPGDRLDFSIDSSGNVQLQAATLSLGQLKGLLQGEGPAAGQCRADERRDQGPRRSGPMNGVDTNVLVRYLTQDDPDQAARVGALMAEPAPAGP